MSFFSAALLLYGVLNIYLLFGTTEWVYVGFLSHLCFNGGGAQFNLSMGLACSSLFIGF
jgi:hypothetical protein